jgi:hypothetical protein
MEEINKLKRLFAVEENALLGHAIRQHTLVRNWILELRSRKRNIQKQTKCSIRLDNPTFKYQVKHKTNL